MDHKGTKAAFLNGIARSLDVGGVYRVKSKEYQALIRSPGSMGRDAMALRKDATIVSLDFGKAFGVERRRKA